MKYSTALFLYIATQKICDALLVYGLWHSSWYLRFQASLIPYPKGLPAWDTYSVAAIPLTLIFCAVFHTIGAYRKDRVHFGFRAIKKIFQGSIFSIMMFVSFCYFFDAVYFSRVFLLLFCGLVVVGLCVERAFLQVLFFGFQKTFVKKIKILLVGSGELLEMYVRKLEARMPYPFEWVGRLGVQAINPATLSHVTYLGEETELIKSVREKTPNLVVVSYSESEHHQYGPLLEQLSHELVDIRVIPEFGRYSTFTYLATEECGVPLLTFNQAPTSASDLAIKRVLDIIGSLVFLVLVSPVYLLLAIAIKLTSKGPVFYSQERMGADGKLFPLYKFRSMRVDAEKETGAVWAVKGDDRTTPIGKWLRKTSLDEIPQFYNVLKGDMSLVGPRPERPVFVEKFRETVPKYMLRHKMKSGITGWAQVNGWRGNTSIEERIKHDLYYIGHWSVWFDIKIIILTFVKGFINPNAY